MKLLLLFVFSIAFAEPTTVDFKIKKLSLGKQTLTVELAETEEQKSQGLMFRKELKAGNGMLFIFQSEELRSFWMKNTFVPLSIGFFNSKKELIDIQDMVPAASEMQTDFPSYQSKGPAQYALEVPKGWFTKHKIKLRQKFQLH
jgi:uncharacterized membrane protein (UPF0127 family)